MALAKMEFPEILKEHYARSDVTVEQLDTDLETWSGWLYGPEEHPEIDFDVLGLKIEAACTYLLWKEGKSPLPSEPRCDVPTGDYYAR